VEATDVEVTDVEATDVEVTDVETTDVVVIAESVVNAGNENDEGTRADVKIEFKKAESVLGIAVHFLPLMERIEAPAGRFAEFDIMKKSGDTSRW
jgi:hypothetical protein